MRKISKIIKIISLGLIISFTSLNSIHDVSAASFSISSSASSVNPDSTFKVYINANDCIGRVDISVTNGTISGDKSVWVENNKTTITVKAGSSGSTKVTVSPQEGFSDGEGEPYKPGSKSVTVKIKTATNNNTGNNNNNTNNNNTNNNNNNTATVTKSKDNNLSSLTVSQGSLSPKFAASTTTYNVNLPGDATKITLSAKANHSKAKVSGTGEKTLDVGKNTFEIKCTAENGSVKTYKINVNVDETPLIYTAYNGNNLGVVRNTNNIGIPSTFEEKNITLEGQEVKGYYSSQFDKTIVYLSDENNVKNFYIYEEEKGIVSIFKPLSLLGRNIYIVDLSKEEQERTDMTYQEIEIDKNKLMGWVYNNPEYSNYSLFMVMNEFGEKVIYQYEKSENSLQLYLDYEPTEDVKSDENIPSEYIFISLTAFFALTTVIMLFVHLHFKKKSIASIKAYYEKRNQN